jgi:hypothetical protein
VIIVEGPDGGGKSTLVKRLHKDFRIALSGHSQLSDAQRNSEAYRSREGVRKRVYGAILREVTARHPPELHDRLFFSAMIYDHVFNREPSFVFEEEIKIGRMLNALKVPVIFCIPPWGAIDKQYVSTGQMDGVPEHIRKIYDQYVQMARFMGHASDRKTLVNRQGKVKRMPQHDYSLPPVLLYDFTSRRGYEEVKMAVSEYLGKRQKRTATWAS